ncbi:hemicentin-1-like [Solea solea]|uniref:hemicentin-1-like n=1 Tax=Solea solea TaxID=90069 RepID=UPI00272A9835|nr:hemicentin-1-like [Solea solea]
MSNSASFVRLFVGLILTVTGAHSSCPVELSPSRVAVRYGDSVSVNCSTSETHSDGIGWEAPLGGRNSEKVNHLTWTVKNLTLWDISPYCFIAPSQHSTFNMCFKSAEVVLYSFPENIDILTNHSADSMEENKEYGFTCVIKDVAPANSVTVRWYKGDTLTSEETFDVPQKGPANLSSVYKLNSTRRDNGVSVRCEAHMDLGPEGPKLNASSQEIKITVFYGPDLFCSVLNTVEGDTFDLCNATGNPTPTLTWWKDGHPKNMSVPLSREDTGQLVVKAMGFTSVTEEIQISVQYGPELTCPVTYTAIENTFDKPNCTAVGFPIPIMQWFKDGEEVVLPPTLTRNDAGQYTVIASSSSLVNATVDIIIQYAPSQILELEDSEVEIGLNVSLKCSSMGNPRSNYTWIYFEVANVMEENVDGVSLLHIHNATASNMGDYICKAWNERGAVTKTVKVTVKGAGQECPIEITPQRMVIPYKGRSETAVCKPTPIGANNGADIKWQDVRGQIFAKEWRADTNVDWDPRPACTAKFRGLPPCKKDLSFTLYKTPDSVSILPVHNLSSLVEGEELQLRCDVIRVAPAQNVTVRWYHGNDTVEPLIKGSMRLMDCVPKNGTNCDIGELRHPLSVSSTISVRLDRKHNRAEFRCEALLDLGHNGLKLSPEVSNPVNVTVHYKPVINTTKLPNTVPVITGYHEELVCEAEGHPPPKIQWLYSPDKAPRMSNGMLLVTEAGFYTCNATNEVDSAFHVVEVILKVDHLPLIAGFVAIAVIAISIIFVFIFSIYYKNTRMRHYNLKNPKLSTHNGNVAHNGWDTQLPMTKLVIASTGTFVSADEMCQLHLSPPRVVVAYGDSISANCSSSSNQSKGIGWESPLGGIGFQQGFSFLALKIDKVSQWSFDAMCYINHFSDIQCIERLPVKVYKLPDSVSMTVLTQTGSMVEGSTYQVQCDVTNVAPAQDLTVYWHKGNKVHSETFKEPIQSPVNKSSVYFMRVNREDNGAQVWCEAKLNVMPTGAELPTTRSKAHSLTVLYAPTFKKPENETLEVPAERKVMYLDCAATGNPPPVYSWRFPQALEQMDKFKNDKRLALDKFLQFPGTYACTSSNSQGMKTKYITLVEPPGNPTTFAAIIGVFVALGVVVIIVGLLTLTPNGTFSACKGGYVRGQPASSGPPSRVVVGFGEPVSVSCEATRPVRVLGWESVISAAHTQQDLSVQWKVDSLIDWIEEPICYGVFFTAPRQCEEKLNLVLYKTPDSVSIRPVNHTGPMIEGREYQLLCEVQNVAPVQYLTLRWYRGQTEVYNHSFSDLTSSSPVQVSSVLLVTPTKAEDGAQYRCVAELELGPEGPQPSPAVTSEPLNASVYFPPMFLSPETQVLDIAAGADVSLNCTATGNPSPIYSWQSSHPVQQERSEDDAVLTSSSLPPGTYTCTASNALEKKSKQFILKVKTKGV